MSTADQQRGVEIVRTPAVDGVSIVRGSIKIETRGQPIDLSFERQWGQVYLVVDCSGSMSGYKLEQAKEGIIDFAKDAVRREFLVGLIKFNSSATHICEPIRDIVSLERHLKIMMATGSTNMTDAIKMAHEHLKRVECSRAIVIATDGLPNNVKTSIKAGQLAKNDGIDIITIGTDDADRDFLSKLASQTELSTKVSREMFAKAISSASNLLPAPRKTNICKK